MQGDLIRTLLIADIISLARERFEFSEGEILTARPFQCLLPYLAFQHDGLAQEQVFCPQDNESISAPGVNQVCMTSLRSAFPADIC